MLVKWPSGHGLVSKLNDRPSQLFEKIQIMRVPSSSSSYMILLNLLKDHSARLPLDMIDCLKGLSLPAMGNKNKYFERRLWTKFTTKDHHILNAQPSLNHSLSKRLFSLYVTVVDHRYWRFNHPFCCVQLSGFVLRFECSIHAIARSLMT